MRAGPLGMRLFAATKAAAGSLGPEIVVTGDFSSSTGWTHIGSACSISGGVANFTASNGYDLTQTNAGIVTGHTYRVAYTVVSASAGNIGSYIGSLGNNQTLRTTAGTYSQDVVADSGGELGFVTGGGGFTGSVDNLSVKEVF